MGKVFVCDEKLGLKLHCTQWAQTATTLEATEYIKITLNQLDLLSL